MRNLPHSPATHHEYPAPILQFCNREDIPSLVRVARDAQKSSSLLYFFSYPEPEDEKKAERQMIEAIERVWGDPRARFLKTVDAKTGEITAFAMWALKGWGFHGKGTEEIADVEEALGSLRVPGVRRERGNRDEAEGPGDKLHDYLTKECDKFFTSWTNNTKHIYLAGLMTSPKFQRRGLGTALLEEGHKFADANGVPSFLVATPVGHPLYLHQGWKEVHGICELDLTKWVEGAESGDQGWGVYKFYYMMRLPRNWR